MTTNCRINFWNPRFGSEEKDLVSRVIDSGFVNDGKFTAEFERRLAELLGAKHVVATTSGTSAIFLALAGLGIGPGDEVIVPDITFIATANAVTLTGARPILADVDSARLTLDAKSVEGLISARTKVVIPVHVSGRAADLDRITDLARRRDIFVIEDAAEALLSKRNRKCLGTFGIAGCFSLSPNKTITTGQGGYIVTNDDRLHTRVRELKDQGRPIRGSGGDDVHSSIGFNFKFTDLQAAMGLGQLERLQGRLERMTAIQRAYAEQLVGIKSVSMLPFDIAGGEAPQWTDGLFEDRDGLYDHLATKGICCRKFWHPLHTQTPYKVNPDKFPISTRQGSRAMWLPSDFALSDADVRTVCDEIRSFYA